LNKKEVEYSIKEWEGNKLKLRANRVFVVCWNAETHKYISLTNSKLLFLAFQFFYSKQSITQFPDDYVLHFSFFSLMAVFAGFSDLIIA